MVEILVMNIFAGYIAHTMKHLFTILLFVISMSAHAQEPIDTSNVGYNLMWLENNDTTLPNVQVDATHHLKMDISRTKNTVSFFITKDNKTSSIGTFKTTFWNACEVWLEDLNGDGVDEIMLSTCPNMNSNKWYDVFMFSPKKNLVFYSGTLNTDYVVDTVNKSIKVTYEGSWYMERHKALYLWQGEKLLLEKKIVMTIPNGKMYSDSLYLEYYKSIPSGSGHLKRTMRKLFSQEDPTINDMWDHFFDK